MYITASVFIVVFLVLIILGAIPFLGKVKRSSQNLVSQKVLLNLVNARIVEVEGFQDGHSQLRQELHRIESVFVEKDSPVVFLNHLENTAQKANLSIDVYPSSVSIESTDLWSSIALQLSINGDVKDYLRFLKMLEHSEWMFEISYVSLDKTSKSIQYNWSSEDLEEGKAYMSIAVKAYSGEPL